MLHRTGEAGSRPDSSGGGSKLQPRVPLVRAEGRGGGVHREGTRSGDSLAHHAALVVRHAGASQAPWVP